MNIIVIDDDTLFSDILVKDISIFFHKFNSNVKIEIYNSDFRNIDFNRNFRIAFVDIDLKDINGIQLSKKIKKFNHNCDIVFVSAKNSLIHSSLSVQPFFFIRKSNYSDDLYVFYQLIRESLSNGYAIQVSYKSDRITISTQDIIYIESIQHILHIFTNHGTYKDGRTLKEFLSLLPINQFSQIHRAFVVNCKYIYSTSCGSVILHKIPNSNNDNVIKLRISRSFQKQFENEYQEYLLL